MADFTNPVPLGQAGTGAAFLLPESGALNQYLANREQQRVLEAQQAAAQKKAQLAVNKSYADNQVKVLPGQLFSGELNGLMQQHIDQGVKYRQQGFDVYNPDPTNQSQVDASQQYLRDQSTLEQIQNFRKNLEEHTYNKALDDIQDPDKSGKLDPESVGTFQKYFSENPDNNKLQNLFYGKDSAPTLQRAFLESDFNDKYVKPQTTEVTTNDGFTKTTKVVPNIGGIRTQVESGLLTDPTANKMLAKNGVDVSYLKGTKDKTGVWRDVDAYYSSAEGKKKLANEGIDYNSDQYWELVKQAADDRITRSTDAFNKISQKLVDNNAAKLQTKDDSSKEYEGLNYALRLKEDARSQERLNLAKQKLAKDKKASEIFSEPDYATVHIAEPQAQKGTDSEGKPKQYYNTASFTTAWQPVKGEGIALDVANDKTIDLKGNLITSRTGGVNRMRLVQVGNIPKLPDGTFVNDASMNILAQSARDYAIKHPGANRYYLKSGGSISLPKTPGEITPEYLSNILPTESVAMLYDDQSIKGGKLAQGAKPVLIPARQIMNKIKANKLKVPQDDFLNLENKPGEAPASAENDPFGLFN